MAQQAVVPLREYPCPDHEKGKISMVCKDCDFKKVCLTCIATSHQGHHFMEIEEFVKIKKDSLKDLLTDVQEKQDVLQKHLQNTKEVGEESSRNSKSVKSQITQKAEAMKKLIDKWSTESHEVCDRAYAEHSDIIKNTEKKLTDQTEGLFSVKTRSEVALASTSYEDVTSLEEALLSLVTDVQIPTVPVLLDFELWSELSVDIEKALGTLLTLGIDLGVQRSVLIQNCFDNDPCLKKGDFSGIPITAMGYRMYKDNRKISKEEFLKEAQILRHLHHPNVIKLHGVIKSHNEQTYIMEDMSQGFLLDYLISKGEELTLSLLLDFSAQVAAGMEYVASKKIIHGDLAAKHILVVSNTTVKVAEFFMAIKLKDETSQSLRTGKIVVCIKWSAIEVIQKQIFSFASDVWSFGVLVWEIMSQGSPPYEGMTNKECIARVSDGYRLPKPRQCPRNVYEALMKCWDKDPKQRPTFEELGEDFRSSKLTAETPLPETESNLNKSESLENLMEPDLKESNKPTDVAKPLAASTTKELDSTKKNRKKFRLF